MERFRETHADGDDGRFVEELIDDGEAGGLVAVAPHGGHVEPATGLQAARLAARVAARGGAATCWRCRGTVPGDGAFDRWHVPSTDLDPAEFPLLARVADRGFDRAVAFHGYGGGRVLVGGAAPEAEKRRVADAVAAVVDAPVAVTASGPYGGTSPDNLVNWLTDGAGGVQLEQSAAVRDDAWRAVADAVAGVLTDGDRA